MSITDYIAIWGALIGTASLIWNFVTYKKNKAIIRVAAYIMKDASNVKYLTITITNVGQRTSTINSIGLTILNSNETIWINPIKLPISLNESQEHIELYNSEECQGRVVKKLWVTDSHNKRWHISKANITKLNEQIQLL